MCATHSQPAFCRRACWNGAVASAFLANCFAMVLATNLLMMSPTTITLTPPSGFANAVNQPTRMPSITSLGTSPTSSFEATCTNNSESSSHKDGEQVTSSNARRTCRSSSSGGPQTREKNLTIQLKSLHWFRSQNLLAQCMSCHRRTTNRVCPFSQCGPSFPAQSWHLLGLDVLQTTLPNAPDCVPGPRASEFRGPASAGCIFLGPTLLGPIFPGSGAPPFGAPFFWVSGPLPLPGGPEGWGLQNFTLFFPSPTPLFILQAAGVSQDSLRAKISTLKSPRERKKDTGRHPEREKKDEKIPRERKKE